MKLNLGCGDRPLSDWINIDAIVQPGVDMVVDLNQIPWPWEDNAVDEIYTSHCLEHLNDPVVVVQEMHRVLKVGGKVTIIVPHNQGILAHTRTHRHQFSTVWFYGWLQKERHQFDFSDDPRLFDGFIKLRSLSTQYPRRGYTPKVYILMKIARAVLLPIEWLANINWITQFAAEKLWFPGWEEIEFYGIKTIDVIKERK